MKPQICADRRSLGKAAAAAIAETMRAGLASRGYVRVLFGSAPSQDETLDSLGCAPGVDWGGVTAFHLDEYVGVRATSPHSFRRYLETHLFSHVRPAVFHAIQGEAVDLQGECERYAGLLDQAPPDIALLGIGENGHLAFNDPPCDFHDPARVKVVQLAESCRAQQVHDGAFAILADVPRLAITLTIPALLEAPSIFVIVPGLSKATAVRRALEDPISPDCPASILRTHQQVEMFLDRESSSQLS